MNSIKNILKNKRKILLPIIIGLLAVALCFFVVPKIANAVQGSVPVGWIPLTDGIYELATDYSDPNDGTVYPAGTIVFQSVDKQKSSDVFYRTVGYAAQSVNEDGTLNQDDKIYFSLNNDLGKITDSWKQGSATIIETTWFLTADMLGTDNYAWLMQKAKELSTISFTGLITIHDPSDPNAALNGMLGSWDNTLGPIGQVWDLTDPAQVADIVAKYPWMQKYVNNHIDHELTLLDLLQLEGEDKDEFPVPTEPGLDDEIIDVIGKDSSAHGVVPGSLYYSTWNYNPDNQFDLGDGIPTSEKVRNGFETDEWYGYSFIGRRKNATHYWLFSYTPSWTETRLIYISQYQDPIEVSYTITGTQTSVAVYRQVGYYYLRNVNFYDFSGATTRNDVYPGGSHNFTDSPTNISMDATYNVGSTIGRGTGDTAPNDDNHVKWNSALVNPGETFQLGVVHSGSSEADAAALAKSMAEARIKASGEIEVANDLLQINGHTYMSNGYYEYKYIGEKREGAGNNSYSIIGEGDYGLYSKTTADTGENEVIPASTKNGEHPTSLVTNYYTRMGTQADPAFTDLIIKNGSCAFGTYQSQEPIKVHTPTVSAVQINDPATGTILGTQTVKKTQLLNDYVDLYADYQLLLDGTYQIKFNVMEHFFTKGLDKHQGYDWNNIKNNIYNKYCFKRQVRFPFAVIINDVYYEPSDSHIDTNGVKYTEWIDTRLDQSTLPGATDDSAFKVDFYIPTWAKEDNGYIVQYRVIPENIVAHYPDFSQFPDNPADYAYISFEDYNAEMMDGITIPSEWNYVSTYTMDVQLSGIIYDFMAVGVDDSQAFVGPSTYTSLVPFAPTKQEKRSGTKNRLGGDYVRYQLDGSLTTNWDPYDTLPFSLGRSKVNAAEGMLRRGSTFAFTVKTIANLYNEEGDYIEITPDFRYISPTGAVTEDIDVYYSNVSSDGKQKNNFVAMGSDIDKANFYEASISDTRFDGSYNTKDNNMVEKYSRYFAGYRTDDAIDPNKNWGIPQDDAEFSRTHANEYLYKKNIAALPNYPQEYWANTNQYLNKTGECYSLGKIILNSRLRLLTGNINQLERNLDKEGSTLEFIKIAHGTNIIREDTNPEYWYKHRESMQTWFGTYYIPDALYITKDKFTVDYDLDGDGIKETTKEYDTLWEYISDDDGPGYITGDEDFFINNGYVVVNFDIQSTNTDEDGRVVNKLSYGGDPVRGDEAKNQWVIEQQPTTTRIGDLYNGPDGNPDYSTTLTINVKPGDIAVIDLRTSMTDYYNVGYNRIN